MNILICNELNTLCMVNHQLRGDFGKLQVSWCKLAIRHAQGLYSS
jgi:hypothetical protein